MIEIGKKSPKNSQCKTKPFSALCLAKAFVRLDHFKPRCICGMTRTERSRRSRGRGLTYFNYFTASSEAGAKSSNIKSARSAQALMVKLQTPFPLSSRSQASLTAVQAHSKTKLANGLEIPSKLSLLFRNDDLKENATVASRLHVFSTHSSFCKGKSTVSSFCKVESTS